MDNRPNKNHFKRKLTRQERNKIYAQPKPNTLWDMISEDSKKVLMLAKSRVKDNKDAKD